MKFPRVALGAATVLAQAVLPSAADALKPKRFAATLPQADLASVGERNLAAAKPGPFPFMDEGDEKPQLVRPSSRKLQTWTPVGATIVSTDRNMEKISMTADGNTLVTGGTDYAYHCTLQGGSAAGFNFVHKTFDGESWVTANPALNIAIERDPPNPGYPIYFMMTPTISGDGRMIGVRTQQWLDRETVPDGIHWDQNAPQAFFFNETDMVATTTPRFPGSNMHDYYRTSSTGVYNWCYRMSANGAAFLIVDNRHDPHGYVYVWNGNTNEWEEDHTWRLGYGHVNLCSISGDGRRVMTGSLRAKDSQFWQKNLVTNAWEEVEFEWGFSCSSQRKAFSSVQISADGNRVVAYVFCEVDSRTWQEKVYDWDHDQKVLVASDKAFQSGRTACAARHHYECVDPDQYAISHDGTRIAVRSGEDELIRVFEEGETSWELIFELATDRDRETAWCNNNKPFAVKKQEGAALNCDGTVVAWSEDNRIRVYRDPRPTDTSTCHPSALGGNTYNGMVDPSGGGSQAGPWEIQHISLYSNFSSPNEISSDFFIGKDRESEVLLLDKDCMSNITDIVINTTKVVANQNSTHDLLSVGLSVDKSAIGNSSVYNKTSNEMKLCQVTRLVLPGSKSGGNGALTIAEHLLQIAVAFDLSANFNFTAGLEAEKIFNETEEVNAATAVDAFKCDKSFNPNDDALGPNDEMFTCVRSKDAAFQVQEVERMTISQIGKQQDLEVIAGGVVQIPSISTRDYTAEGAIVGSRIPINLFDFEDGAFLKISGAVTMKLADGTSRRLNVELGSAIRDLQEETEEASYTVDVALQAAEESAIDLSNSAAGVAAAALGGFAIAAFFLLL